MSKIDYFVTIDPDATEMHLVHSETCSVLPDEDELEELGKFSHCEDAMEAASDVADGPVNGCPSCCADCHEPVDMGYDMDDELAEDDD